MSVLDDIDVDFPRATSHPSTPRPTATAPVHRLSLCASTSSTTPTTCHLFERRIALHHPPVLTTPPTASLALTVCLAHLGRALSQSNAPVLSMSTPQYDPAGAGSAPTSRRSVQHAASTQSIRYDDAATRPTLDQRLRLISAARSLCGYSPAAWRVFLARPPSAPSPVSRDLANVPSRIRASLTQSRSGQLRQSLVEAVTAAMIF